MSVVTASIFIIWDAIGQGPARIGLPTYRSFDSLTFTHQHTFSSTVTASSMAFSLNSHSFQTSFFFLTQVPVQNPDPPGEDPNGLRSCGVDRLGISGWWGYAAELELTTYSGSLLLLNFADSVNCM
ncbi:hypothetical protein GGS21DRAFT_460076 [Xylaria nigripes]|nr:hypothetical protein GGS21DRAFT_460076 [Xylaria nigripes]